MRIALRMPKDGCRGRKRMLSIKVALVFAPIILLSCDQLQPAQAIFNCLTPNMFKMGKGGQPLAYGAERANWYPQQQVPYQPNYATQMSSYGQHPMKLLFQPKWKGGSLFGSKGWNSWKMGSNSNFYRPNYNYGSSGLPGYQFSEQLNVAPFAIPSPNSNSYLQPMTHNDGWSTPLNYNQAAPIQQAPMSAYDSYSQQNSPVIQPFKPQVDPYGTKGGSGGQKSTTTKNILMANGGYSAYDAHLVNALGKQYGYSYPDWYSGSIDSPARIAQQLIRYGMRRQRQDRLNQSATLLDISARPLSNSFTMLDEPRFVGFGKVDSLDNREARLSCSFSEAIDQTNSPLWVKFSGPYNSSQVINGKPVPPFNCADSRCRTQEVESTKDFRYKFDNGPATSTLIISEPRLSDYGIYRCSALTRAINNNPLETIYQIVQFGSFL